jgi:hypothetical protein
LNNPTKKLSSSSLFIHCKIEFEASEQQQQFSIHIQICTLYGVLIEHEQEESTDFICFNIQKEVQKQTSFLSLSLFLLLGVMIQIFFYL